MTDTPHDRIGLTPTVRRRPMKCRADVAAYERPRFQRLGDLRTKTLGGSPGSGDSFGPNDTDEPV